LPETSLNQKVKLLVNNESWHQKPKNFYAHLGRGPTKAKGSVSTALADIHLHQPITVTGASWQTNRRYAPFETGSSKGKVKQLYVHAA